MKSTISLWLLTCATLPLMAQKTIEVSVVNPSSQARNDQPVVLQLERYGQDIRSALVMCEGKEIPCQLDDLDQNDSFDELCFLADLGKKYRVSIPDELLEEGANAKTEKDFRKAQQKIRFTNKNNTFFIMIQLFS